LKEDRPEARVYYQEVLSPVEFERLLRSYETWPGKGLPIGSLTSQHLANFYLDALDRFVKERLRRPYYVRYMDDFALWGGSAAELHAVQSRIAELPVGQPEQEQSGQPEQQPWFPRSSSSGRSRMALRT
jgi:hypothetical protein